MVKPQQLQHFEDGKYWSMATTDRPAHLPLYWSWRTSSLQPASAIALDSFGLRIMFFTLRDSTQTTWFSLISLRDNLCRLSIRQSAIFAWSRATFKRALIRFLEPFCFLLKRRCSSVNRFAYLAVWRGLSVLNPVSVTNKSFKPTSMPTVLAVTGIDTRFKLTQAGNKVLPALSLEMVTVDGADGNSRLQRTSSGDLLFAIYNSPSPVFKRAGSELSHLFVPFAFESRIATRPAKKLAKAACWWRNDCWRGTQETSFSHMYSGSFLSAVRRALACR